MAQRRKEKPLQIQNNSTGLHQLDAVSLALGKRTNGKKNKSQGVSSTALTEGSSNYTLEKNTLPSACESHPRKEQGK